MRCGLRTICGNGAMICKYWCMCASVSGTCMILSGRCYISVIPSALLHSPHLLLNLDLPALAVAQWTTNQRIHSLLSCTWVSQPHRTFRPRYRPPEERLVPGVRSRPVVDTVAVAGTRGNAVQHSVRNSVVRDDRGPLRLLLSRMHSESTERC